MVRCFSVSTVRPRLDRPLPGPRPRPRDEDGEKDFVLFPVAPLSSSLSGPAVVLMDYVFSLIYVYIRNVLTLYITKFKNIFSQDINEPLTG